MNKEKRLKIICIVAVLIDLIIFVGLLYSNYKLSQEVHSLQYSYKELQNVVFEQETNISNMKSQISEMSEFFDEMEEQENQKNDPYYDAINNLDSTIFLTDFENYSPNNNDIVITEKRAKEIAQKGFAESKRIASEGTDEISSETIKIEEVVANNYFTRYYYQRSEFYDKIKRNCYAIQRENDMGCGVTIYVDVTTGLIIAGRAFGD